MLYCDACGDSAATVFVTKMSRNYAEKRNLCALCSRRESKDDGVMANLHFDKMSLDEIARNLLESAEETPSDDAQDDDFQDPFAQPELPPLSDFQVPDLSTLAASFGEGGAKTPSRETASARCPKCGTTWDRLKQDGRAGCARCYEAFSEQLIEVMERVHKAAQHAGKTPRAMEKRKRRLHYLRARRDNRLEMLQRRLKETLALENYEEAAQLRDKIRILTNTIVHDD
ncbi:MAG: hypothetical protein ACR2MB_12775 [Acidimicrobiales bacterium]